MRIKPIILAAFGAAALVNAAEVGATSHCWEGLGTSRIAEVDVSETFGIGGSRYQPLPLEPGEVVLTFDDGPVGGSTRKVLHALAKECVRATFFMMGRRAESDPLLVRRVRYSGHTVASHTYTHPDLTTLSFTEAKRQIVVGYRAVERAAYRRAFPRYRARFFRFPNFRSNDALEAYARGHGMTFVNADMSPKDWRGDPPDETLQRMLKLLDRKARGIIVLHDSEMNTARMLPQLLGELKARNVRVVHIVPK